MSQEVIDEEQKALCVERGVIFTPTPLDSILGFALATRGLVPINGLRHPAGEGSNGWYLWCGERYSSAPDFFLPTHARHVYEEIPSVSKLLGLPPGYRFLLAGDYLDVWYDDSLLRV